MTKIGKVNVLFQTHLQLGFYVSGRLTSEIHSYYVQKMEVGWRPVIYFTPFSMSSHMLGLSEKVIYSPAAAMGMASSICKDTGGLLTLIPCSQQKEQFS